MDIEEKLCTIIKLQKEIYLETSDNDVIAYALKLYKDNVLSETGLLEVLYNQRIQPFQP
jgi:hypothetical protein